MLSRKPGLRVESQFRELFTSLNSNYNHSTILTNLVPYVGQLQLGKFMANRSHIYSVVKKKNLPEYPLQIYTYKNERLAKL